MLSSSGVIFKPLCFPHTLKIYRIRIYRIYINSGIDIQCFLLNFVRLFGGDCERLQVRSCVWCNIDFLYFKSCNLNRDVYTLNIPTVCFFFQESALSGEEDTYTDSHFHDIFNEDCIVLDPVSVLPLQYKITRNLLPLSGKSLLLLV